MHLRVSNSARVEPDCGQRVFRYDSFMLVLRRWALITRQSRSTVAVGCCLGTLILAVVAHGHFTPFGSGGEVVAEARDARFDLAQSDASAVVLSRVGLNVTSACSMN